MNTYVRSWVPTYGEIVGMVIRHGESFTMGDFLTVWQDDIPVYRPTVHYAYQPADAAVASLQELRARNYQVQSRMRIMNDDIISGRDELGVLLMGHDMTSWWVGSQLAGRRFNPRRAGLDDPQSGTRFCRARPASPSRGVEGRPAVSWADPVDSERLDAAQESA